MSFIWILGKHSYVDILATQQEKETNWVTLASSSKSLDKSLAIMGEDPATNKYGLVTKLEEVGVDLLIVARYNPRGKVCNSLLPTNQRAERQSNHAR